MPSPPMTLEAQVARDLERLGLPPKPWPIPHDGLDVLVIGAGMCGTAAAAALKLKGIANIQILDSAPNGQEGPWTTTARMKTLRSPKHLPGIALGIPSLTFRAWFTANRGEEAWTALHKIANADWQAYLTWLQKILDLPVQHETSVTAIHPSPTGLAIETTQGPLAARHVVLATGRLGAGGMNIPAFIDPALWPDRAAHAAEPIAFPRLAGKKVAVLGANAAAFDNAAEALEHGAASVDIYCRRPTLPQVNKSRGATNPGYFEGWSALPPPERWRLMAWLHDERSPPPHESVHRALAHPGFTLHFAAPVEAASRTPNGIALTIAGQPKAADFLILATGFDVNLSRRPELAALAPNAALWGEAGYTPHRPELAHYPILGPGFELTERIPGTCPALSRLHIFNHAAYASMGAIASDIPGVSTAAQMLASALLRALFVEDHEALQSRLAAFAEPELESTPYFVPPAPK